MKVKDHWRDLDSDASATVDIDVFWTVTRC